jgi:cell shape-determining protein MreC
MDELGDIIIPVVALVSIFVVPPVLFFISKNAKHKREMELEKMKYQKEILELEIEKQNNQIKLLEEENKKLDKMINEKWENI